jgi:hypothetical protein
MKSRFEKILEEVLQRRKKLIKWLAEERLVNAMIKERSGASK